MKKRIILIRHCTPNMPNRKCTAEQAKQYLIAYDNTEDINLSEIACLSSQTILNEIKQSECVYSSPLPRARITAEYLFERDKIIFCDELKEFNLHIADIPLLSLSVSHWFVISRLLWFIGLNRASKTPSQEKLRVNNFMQKVPIDQNCAIVAHGLVIREMKKILAKQGYRQTFSEKQGCFSITILEP
ncbi:histidine phosphatase family protein [Rodentibacter sp. Ppn85]|uniref:histidine phosphatase family protein n=1 Tax=Rodentibacter sp. Ppn85 TaxID=1908525 RepID=UPI00098454CB|nr:histidine phosphatase family protein [Rodentibacter sp. Ppn85]OOF65472.1 hypothetical protein BKL51_05610 [Rodentibacter sp. Ppn85]